MKTTAMFLLGLLLLSCGGDDEYVFQSLARTPEGEPILFRYRMVAGECYVTTQKMEIRVSMELDGDRTDMPMKIETESIHECKFVEQDGAMRLEVTLSRFTGDLMGESMNFAEEGDFDQPGTILLAPDGTVREIEILWFDEDPETAKVFKQMQGLISFMRFPPAGLRIGEAVDFREMLPAEAFEGALQSVAPGMEFNIQGEMVLDRLEDVDGEQVAVFLVNVVASIRSGNNASMTMNLDMKITGEVRLSVDTGWTIGASSMDFRAQGEMEVGDKSGTLEMSQKIESVTRREVK